MGAPHSVGDLAPPRLTCPSPASPLCPGNTEAVGRSLLLSFLSVTCSLCSESFFPAASNQT